MWCLAKEAEKAGEISEGLASRCMIKTELGNQLAESVTQLSPSASGYTSFVPKRLQSLRCRASLRRARTSWKSELRWKLCKPSCVELFKGPPS